MKKIFIVTGELSGDTTAAWYLERTKHQYRDSELWAIGGPQLVRMGVRLYAPIEKLNVTGAIEILKHIPRLLYFLKTLVNFIEENNFSEVILVDFPGFNLRVAQNIKKKCPHIKVTYVAPPQLWCWGAWRVKKLQRYCDDIIVLYPFEVDWYKNYGVRAHWLGNPVYNLLKDYFSVCEKKENIIALMPGSRIAEINKLLPLFINAVKYMHEKYPDVRFIMPVAKTICVNTLRERFLNSGVGESIFSYVTFISEEKKYSELAHCCIALSKPGTVTLELALLKVPALVVYKTSWVTYCLAKILSHVSEMSLPNLILKKPVFKELIQQDCTPELIKRELEGLYQSYIKNTHDYIQKQDWCMQLRLYLKTDA
jgi:lipid-A-disaccharide synthase